MASQVLIRTEVAGTGAQYALTQASPLIPFPVSITAAHLYEALDQIPSSGTVQPGGAPRFDLSLESDCHVKESLEMRLSALTLAGGATFARYIDGIGLWFFSELEARFGTERIQTIRPEELFVKLEQWYDDELRTKLRRLMLLGLTPADRERRARTTQDVICPFLTLLGLSFGSDPSQNLFVRGLGEKLQLRLTMRAMNQWIESDVALPGAVTETAATLIVDSSLLSDTQHILDDERAQLESIYSAPRRYVFDEQLFANDIPVAATQALPSTLSGGTLMALRNISQPVTAWAFLFRWADDLARQTGGAGGSRGFNPNNIAGWFNSGGNLTPVISRLGISVGSNAFYWRTQRINRLLEYEKARSFKSSGGQAMVVLAYSWDPTRPNAVFGFVDPSQTDVPQLILEFVSPFDLVAGAPSGFTTLGQVSNNDIGSVSGMTVMPFAFTKNQSTFLIIERIFALALLDNSPHPAVNFDNFSMFHPVN